MARQSEYLLADGSPRYGIRTADAAPVRKAAASPVRSEKLPVEIAAGLNLQQLAMAAALRSVRPRSDDAIARVRRLRTEHVVEHALAVAAAQEHLGDSREWRRTALHTFTDQVVDPLMKSPSVALRFVLPGAAALGLLLAVVALAIMMPLEGFDPFTTMMTVIACFFAGSLALKKSFVRSRYPERFQVNPYLMQDLREDVVDATLVRILQDEDIEIDPVTERMATRGWRDIQAVAAKVDEIYLL